MNTQAMAWTRADSAAASAEGWDVFDSSERGLEIERVDAPEVGDQVVEPTFSEDAKAIGHVYFKAQEGSALHQKALAITLYGMKGFALAATNEPHDVGSEARHGLITDELADALRMAKDGVGDWRAPVDDALDAYDAMKPGHAAAAHYDGLEERAEAAYLQQQRDRTDQITVDDVRDEALAELAEAAGFEIHHSEDSNLWHWSDQDGKAAGSFDSERETILAALDKRYGDDWRFEVANGDTRRGFLEFCEQAVEEANAGHGMKP